MNSQDPGAAPAPHDGAPAAEAARSLWAIGDYVRISDLLLAQGDRLVEWSGLGPGDRVLDVAAGTGAASLPAAATGARVTATDLAPGAARDRRAAAPANAGSTSSGGPADATALPFADASYDVVMSAIGAMFAPDQQATADELVRVCRPGGTIAMANWTPDGGAGRFFGVVAPYVPPPPPGPGPTAWSDPDHVAALFGPAGHRPGHGGRRGGGRLRRNGPNELAALYLSSFPPVVATLADLAETPEREAAFVHDLTEFFRNEYAAGGVRYEYVLVRATVV